MSYRPHIIPCIAAAVLLLVALFELPYGYYIFLRWTVCIAACFTAWAFYAANERPTLIMLLMTVIAILFNPIVPVHLTRSTWAIIDVVTAIVFGTAATLPFASSRQTLKNDPALEREEENGD